MKTARVSRYASRRPVGAFGLMDRIRLNTVVSRFPVSWQSRLVDQLGKLSVPTFDKWRERVEQLSEADRGGVRPDASDADICQAAEVTATDFARRLAHVRVTATGSPSFFARYGQRWVDRCMLAYAQKLMQRRGLVDLLPVVKCAKCGRRGVTVQGLVKRLESPAWWRRALRKLHARTVEACAIGIGLVSKAAGLYVSDDGLRRRIGQNARNVAALESVHAVNDMGQDMTLADLAARGTANKAIRRVELLTRIAGFELIAKDLGHSGCMVTMTCPSRFHRMTTRDDGRVYQNPKYDGSTPHEAQRYLSLAWGRFRAAAARAGLDVYGFRIAEPQHDGTPHWHCLVFYRAGHFSKLSGLVRRYFLDADTPHEPGAQKHRVDFELIDWAKGSAVGYVIKYVSKNIDGHGVGQDLFGNDAITSSARVEAWASTWRIRQFQQIGGAPVGVWRELRRINPDNIAEAVPEALRVAVSAVNAKGEPGMQAVAWKRYIGAQGGIGTKRAAMPLRLLKEDRGDFAEVGKYGEPIAHKLLGIDAAGVQLFRNHIHVMTPDAPAFQRAAFASVESERCRWVTGLDLAGAQRAACSVFERSGEAASTRIHVNNCTGRDLARTSEFAPLRSYAPRLRRFVARPSKPPAPEASTLEKNGQRHQPGERFGYLSEPAPF